MNSFSTKKYLILALVSLILGLAIIRWHTTNNVPACINTPGCQFDGQRGTLGERIYGYPLAYKKVTTFRPSGNNASSNNTSTAQTSIENQAFSVPSVIMNTLFWFGLLHLLARFIKPRQKSMVSGHSQQEDARNT
ncbi:MAG TPA: hypothetical protein VF575_00080 [Candidatus Saccharimonadales bacterium]|jgi:hypothetical protein